MAGGGGGLKSWRWLGAWLPLSILGLAGLVPSGCSGRASPAKPSPPAYEGNSAGLKRTMIVPTLDTPSPADRNVIWCGSFQLAWNGLRDDAFKQSFTVAGAEELSARLNSASFDAGDLPADSYCCAAGAVSDGIVPSIQAEMAAKFPGVTPNLAPEVLKEIGPGGMLAYAYLQAEIKFPVPYFDRDGQDAFEDSAGNRTPVRTFGLSESASSPANRALAKQIQVLYMKEDESRSQPEEFALDLCRNSQTFQIVVARIPRKGTLADTVGDLEAKMAAQAADPDRSVRFSDTDKLIVPEIIWKIDHQFAQLQGPDRHVLGPAGGYWIAQAAQSISFRLDKSGAAVASESRLVAGCIPRVFSLTKPFLVYMTKRGADRPFFVMWVDNAELLSRTNSDR